MSNFQIWPQDVFRKTKFRIAIGILHGQRGKGKTYFAISLGLAIASGQAWFEWKANSPRKVVYVDGEMPLVALQERVTRLVAGIGGVGFDANNFLLIAADEQEPGEVPNLATPEGQRAIEDVLSTDTALVILDNLSCLNRTNRSENEAESWAPVQEFCLRLRQKGIATIVVHHQGKNGQQRGTSKKEDICDLVIGLKQPSDYSPKEGCRFELHFEKSRHLHGDIVSPLEASLVDADSILSWAVKSVEVSNYDRAVQLYNEGMTQQKEISDCLSLSKGQVSKLIKRARQEGRLDED